MSEYLAHGVSSQTRTTYKAPSADRQADRSTTTLATGNQCGRVVKVEVNDVLNKLEGNSIALQHRWRVYYRQRLEGTAPQIKVTSIPTQQT